MFNATISDIKTAFSAALFLNHQELMDKIIVFALLQGGFEVFIALDDEEEAEMPFQEVLASVGEMPIINYHYKAVVGLELCGNYVTIPAHKVGWEVILQALLKAKKFEYISIKEMHENREELTEVDDFVNDEGGVFDDPRERYTEPFIEKDFYQELVEMPIFQNRFLKPINPNPRMAEVHRVEVAGEYCNIYDKEGYLLGKGKLQQLSENSIYHVVESFHWECYSYAQLLNLEPHNREAAELRVKKLINRFGGSSLTITKVGFIETFKDLLAPFNGFGGTAMVSERYAKDARASIAVMAGGFSDKNKVIVLNFPERFYPNNASSTYWSKVSTLIEEGFVFRVKTSDPLAGSFCMHFIETTVKAIDPQTGEIEKVNMGHNRGLSRFYGRNTMRMLENTKF